MLELLANYSVEQIIVFSIVLLLALKGTINFFSWCKEKYQEKFNKDYSKKTKEETFDNYYKEFVEQKEKSLQHYQNLEDKLDVLAETFDNRVDKIEAQLTRLTESDMHAIKGWIVEKHHTLMKRGWVDDFTMDTLEYRYADYVAEDGNSYVQNLMTELRALPHFPPKEEK